MEWKLLLPMARPSRRRMTAKPARGSRGSPLPLLVIALGFDRHRDGEAEPLMEGDFRRVDRRGDCPDASTAVALGDVAEALVQKAGQTVAAPRGATATAWM